MQKFTRFFLGNHPLSLSEEKRATLTVFCLLVWFLTTVYYIVSNLLTGINTFLVPYYIFFVILLISLWLCRRGKYSWAKVFLLLPGNIIVFIYSSLKPAIPSPFLFFIAGCLLAFALFGWEERGKAFFFVGLSFFLMLFDRYSELTFVPSIKLSEAYVMKTFFTNLIIVCIVSVLIVYFLVDVNNQVETSLRNQEMETKKKNEELQKINLELDRFIYSASHDLRAPLKSVLGLIHLGERTSDATELKHYNQLMRERLVSLDKVLNEILDYSRNNKSEIIIQTVKIRDLVASAISDVEYSEEAKNISIEVNVPEDLIIETDALRLGIIINNLVSNAVKYSDLKKEKPKVSVSAAQENGKIVLKIEDNGEGIHSDHHDKIFSMFYRASTKSDGSGLGLYLVKEATEKIDGTIQVESKPGEGSTFTLLLGI